MSELSAGERTEPGVRRFGVKHIDLQADETDHGTSHEVGHDRMPTAEKLRGLGRRAARITDIVSPPTERRTDE